MQTHRTKPVAVHEVPTKSSLPQTGFVRLPQVLAHIPVSSSTWWAGVKSGKYPAPIKLGKNTTTWKAEDIHALIAKLAEQGGSV